MRLAQILMAAAVLAAAAAHAQSDSVIEGRWGRNGRTLLDLDADPSGAVSGKAFYHGGGNPVVLPIRVGRFDTATGKLELEGDVTLPGAAAPAVWTLQGWLLETTLNADFRVGASVTTVALTRVASSALEPGTVLVTGANRGLGLEFARQYAARGWTVIATARNPAEATELEELAAASGRVTIERLDVLDLEAIEALAARYEGKPIDLLINNAGIGGDPALQSLGSFDYELFEEAMAVNVFGPLAVSEALLDNVRASRHKKIVAITSGWGVFSLPRPPGPYFYRASKAALNMAMHAMQTDLRDEQIIVGLVAPGAADTALRRQLQGNTPAPSAEESVAAMIEVIEGLTIENSGQPINFDGNALPW